MRPVSGDALRMSISSVAIRCPYKSPLPPPLPSELLPKLPREKYFNFDSQTINYTITSLGHEIGLKIEYPKSSLMKYKIKLQKNRDKAIKSKKTLSPV